MRYKITRRSWDGDDTGKLRVHHVDATRAYVSDSGALVFQNDAGVLVAALHSERWDKIKAVTDAA